MQCDFRHPTVRLFVSLAALIGTEAGLGANWITPNFPPGTEPDYRPVPLYWFEVKQAPLAYRTILRVKSGLKFAVAEARSPSYLYVFVDGKPVFPFAPKEGAKPDTNNPLHFDLTAELTPGTHALVVSAPRTGFALSGKLQYAKEATPLQTDATWQVMKFPPTVILEDEAWLLPTLAGNGAPVAAGAAFDANPDFARLAEEGKARRAAAGFDNTAWRLGLLAHKGIVIQDGRTFGWAGPDRMNFGIQSKAGELYGRTIPLSRRVDKLRAAAGTNLFAEAAAVSTEVQRLSDETEILSRQQYLLDERKALGLAERIVPLRAEMPLRLPAERAILEASDLQKLDSLSQQLSLQRRSLTDVWGGTINSLNESRHDRLGWLPHPDLVDSQIAAWGLRVNPVTAPTLMKLDGRNWLFQTDPNDSGESEKRETIGYNIENQWPRMVVPRAWNSVDAFKTYRGPAWYRTRVNLPAEWQGHNAVLRFEANDSDKVWMNDVLVSSTAKPGIRSCQIDKSVIRPGAENVVVFKVTAYGEQRGLVGSVTLACPELEGQKPNAPTARVLATPLSPVVVVTPNSAVLEIQGWAERKQSGPREIILPVRSASSFTRLTPQESYQSKRDGKLAANWAMLWLTSTDEKSPDRPVMLVFESQPLGIAHDGEAVRITFSESGKRVAAVRPWVKQIPEPSSSAFAEAISFWQRAALAVPVNYLSLTRTVKAGPPADFPFSITNVPPGAVREHHIIYDYLMLKDDWGTPPLRLAPMPALGSYGIDQRFRGLKFLTNLPETIQDGGLLAPYRVLKDSDRISYSYPIEPFPRLVGFTSWMFAGSDTGVRGNPREVELLKTTGANSYRPQHNFSTEKSPHYPNDARTRVQIMADCCNATGLNYMNNIDQTLGARREFVQTNYVAFMERVHKHYESITGQLHDRPFFNVAYDLVNEPFDHKHEPYNKAMRELTARVRAIDPVHLLYVEPCEAWGAIEQLKLIEPTGDPLTVYSFHDYNFRLFKPGDRWPTAERDISNICRQWTEAFKFAIQHGTGMHCGEFGGFDNSTDNQLAQLTLLNDFFRIFDQFDMHFHYYSGRSVFGRRADGSMALSHVVRAYRRHFQNQSSTPAASSN